MNKLQENRWTCNITVLWYLKLSTLKYKRYRGDIIET